MYVISLAPVQAGRYVHRFFIKNAPEVSATPNINEAMEFNGPSLAAEYLRAEMPALLDMFPELALTIGPKRMYEEVLE